MVVGAGRWLGLLLGLVLLLLFYRFSKVNRACRFAKQIGAQASGDARALRRPVDFVISLTHRGLTPDPAQYH